MLALRDDDALKETIAFAIEHLKGEGSSVRAAAAVAATSLRLRPDSRPLALWLADADLAARMNWPAPALMLAAHIKRGDLRHDSAHADGASAWLVACNLAYARGAAAATDLYVDLAQRADRLLTVAPKLRGKDADRMVQILLTETPKPPAPAGRRAIAARGGCSSAWFRLAWCVS